MSSEQMTQEQIKSDSFTRRWSPGTAGATCLFAGLCLTILVGCTHLIRGQSPDSESMEFDEQIERPVYVGDVGGPVGLDKLKVDGLALVNQLDGTGSEPPSSSQRDFLIAEIKTHQIDDISGMLASKNNSMVMITGHIPAGAKRGDRFDVFVQCMPKSKTKSLRGGYMMQARMKPFVQTRTGMEYGHNSALARGRVAIDAIFESGDDKGKNVSGRVIGGGVVIRDRESGYRLLEEHRSIKSTTSIARAINRRFSTHVEGSPEGVAEPKNDREIAILIPDDYRHNLGRYFHVMLNIAFNETADQRVNRLESLERSLHNPEKTSISAIRLEAIGDEAKSVLKRGLRSDDFQVQFHSAQALAYLGDNSGIDTLREAVEIEPAFRWHALTAIASLKDPASESALIDLFGSDSSEARYGAFRALRESIPDSFMVDPEFASKEFVLHSVPSSARPMIHISRTKVAEIVIFGGDQKMNGRLLYFKSGLTVKAIENGQVEIKRYLPNKEEKKVVCSTLVSDIIRNMVKMGADYGDVLAMLKDAKQSNALESELVINAVPSLGNSYRAAVNRIPESSDTSEKYVSEEMPALFDDENPATGPMAKVRSWRKGIFGRLGGE